MATRKSPRQVPTPQAAILTVSKEQFSSDLKARIQLGEELLQVPIHTPQDLHRQKAACDTWHDFNLELLKQSFNDPYNEYRSSYDQDGEWMGGLITMGHSPSFQEHVQEFVQRLNAKLSNLRSLDQRVVLLKSAVQSAQPAPTGGLHLDKSQVFIVHGHDEAAKQEVARFIDKLGIKPIILHEQASSGKTIIEKIEEYTNVGFGIVLYTECDLGAKKGEEHKLRFRARQNVVFEHGYLIGKIGRKNVCALVKGDVETPGDITGVVYVSMHSDWKLSLAKELRNSGYEVDMNKVV